MLTQSVSHVRQKGEREGWWKLFLCVASMQYV